MNKNIGIMILIAVLALGYMAWKKGAFTPQGAQ